MKRLEVLATCPVLIPEPGDELVPEGALSSPGSLSCAPDISVPNVILRLLPVVQRPALLSLVHWRPRSGKVGVVLDNSPGQLGLVLSVPPALVERVAEDVVNLVPTMQKKLFTSSFQAKFLKIGFTKVTATSIKSYVAVNFFVPQSQLVLGACFGP